MQAIWAEKSRLGPGSHPSRRTGEAVPSGLPTRTMETNRPMWGWQCLGKLPGESGTSGHQEEDAATTKENDRKKLDENRQWLGCSWGGQHGRRAPYLEVLPSSSMQHWHQSGALITA